MATKKLIKWTTHDNIAEELPSDVLSSIGSTLCTAIKADDLSREKWLKDNDKWLKLAQQVMEDKNYPWQGASNIKYPTLSIAAIQFHAQSFPTLLGRKEIVKCKIPGLDGKPPIQQGMSEEDIEALVASFTAAKEAKKARAERVSKFMSIQALDLMEGWIDDMDRLLLILPIVGLVYKKTFFSPSRNRIVSEMISARDLILNYNAKNYERARKTHRLWLDANEIFEAKASGIYLKDQELPPANDKQVPGTRDKAVGLQMISSETHEIDSSQYEIYESHCWIDLDEDGYKEPYIVTIEADTEKVLRIVARWDDEASLIYEGTTLIRIEPSEYFTPYRLFPDPESSVYALGFGRLLGPANVAVNGIINMLMDAGHLNTLGGGFIGRGARTMGGKISLRPNEWIEIQSTGEDLRKSIVPRETQEPSPVLFQMLGMMIGAGKDLSTVQDIFMGKNPGQNQPHKTTKDVIEQGLKVFNGIYKRVYRSMSSEFRKIYHLNYTKLPMVEYMNVLDDPAASQDDFLPDGLDIIPSAEPDMIAEAEKIMKANTLIGKMQAGMKLNSGEVTRRVLEAEGHENIDALMAQEPEKPDVKMLEFQLKVEEFKHKQVLDQITAVRENAKVKSQALRDEANAMAVMMNANTTAKAEDRALMELRIKAINEERDDMIEMASKEMELLMKQLDSKDKEKDRDAKERSDARKASSKKTKSS